MNKDMDKTLMTFRSWDYVCFGERRMVSWKRCYWIWKRMDENEFRRWRRVSYANMELFIGHTWLCNHEKFSTDCNWMMNLERYIGVRNVRHTHTHMHTHSNNWINVCCLNACCRIHRNFFLLLARCIFSVKGHQLPCCTCLHPLCRWEHTLKFHLLCRWVYILKWHPLCNEGIHF